MNQSDPSRLNLLQLIIRSALAVLMSCVVSSTQAATESKVTLVLSDENPIYLRFAKTYSDTLPNSLSLTVIHGADNYLAGTQSADLVVTVGSKAASALVDKTSKPILLTMLPSNLYADLARKRPRPSQLSALYVDQPWSRYIELLFAALPQTRKIGVLNSSNSGINLDELSKLATRHEAKLIVNLVPDSESIFHVLEDTLNHSEVLLAIPDNLIYSNNNIRNILMTSYRHRVPLIGLSKGYVNAGALCAVYSSPEDLARQASAMTLSFALGKHLPPAQFPIEYEIATNLEVARTLGIKLDSVEQLHLQLQRAEGRQ